MSINTMNMSNVMFRSSAVMGKPMAVDNHSNPEIAKFVSRTKDEVEFLKAEYEYTVLLDMYDAEDTTPEQRKALAPMIREASQRMLELKMKLNWV